jgi:hypothetical protein
MPLPQPAVRPFTRRPIPTAALITKSPRVFNAAASYLPENRAAAGQVHNHFPHPAFTASATE